MLVAQGLALVFCTEFGMVWLGIVTAAFIGKAILIFWAVVYVPRRQCSDPHKEVERCRHLKEVHFFMAIVCLLHSGSLASVSMLEAERWGPQWRLKWPLLLAELILALWASLGCRGADRQLQRAESWEFAGIHLANIQQAPEKVHR
ncbi:unnamed protein product [Effrenium voratum]|nr:unnamed protein product [Effrenium voratum]